MFALVNGQELILGPIKFNIRMINYELNELGLNRRVITSDYTQVPIHFTDNIHLLLARNEIPEYNHKFETISQHSHTITETEVIFTYIKTEKSLEQIKAERKTEVAPIRKLKESKNIEVYINGVPVQVSIDRNNRLALIVKMLSNEGTYKFKFNSDTWVDITKNDLQYIIAQIDTSVQEAFDWEYNKLQEIDACETKEAVYEVVIERPVQESTIIEIANA
jgi:hypothetical protein